MVVITFTVTVGRPTNTVKLICNWVLLLSGQEKSGMTTNLIGCWLLTRTCFGAGHTVKLSTCVNLETIIQTDNIARR